MYKEPYIILCYYLKKAGVFINKSRLNQLLASHPDNNSFYAMVDVLDELNIENIALRLDMDSLRENGFPVIVHTGEKNGSFIVIENIIGDKIHYYNSKRKKIIEPVEEFSAEWSGVALYAAQNEIQAELVQKKTSKEVRILQLRTPLAVMAGLICVITWIFTTVWSIALIWISSLCVLGLTISILLTIHEFGKSNRLIHKVCHLNRLTNCNAVLSSPAAKLFGWLSMSDIGLCYFAGSLLSIIIAGLTQFSNMIVSLLLVLSLFTFPYTLFSLWYQRMKIKKVCPLCLGIISVLWAEIALTFYCLPAIQLFPVSSITVFSLFAGFTIPVVVWAYIKPLWKEYNRVRTYEYKYLRLKRIPSVIRAMFARI